MFDPVAYINAPHWRSMNLGLDRIKELLEGLGNPHNALRFVHVAGTNGKGSTCAFLAAILQQAGYKTGLFTSPYIERFEERIQINKTPIAMDELRAVTLTVRAVAERMTQHPSEFELMTAVAFTYFAQQQCDIVVAEVGLGGRLDSTNIIETVQASVITPISLDHCGVLGSTIGAIAAEKAGIIKQGVPVISAPQAPEALDCLAATAAAKQSELRLVRNGSWRGDSTAFSCGDVVDVPLGLAGSYQCMNAAVALEVCTVLRCQGWHIPAKAMSAGLTGAEWPGRFEVVHTNPTVVLDGAHNIQACAVLAQELIAQYAPARMLFIMGVMEDKAYATMLNPLVAVGSVFLCVQPDNPRALSAEVLAQAVQHSAAKQGNNQAYVQACSSIKQAFSVAKRMAQPGDVICVCGSLYQIAAAKQALRYTWPH